MVEQIKITPHPGTTDWTSHWAGAKQSRDSAAPDRDGAVTRNFRVAEEGLLENENRTWAGQDDGEGEITPNPPSIGETMDSCINMIGQIARKSAAQARDAAISARRRDLRCQQRAADRREQRRQELERQSFYRTREILETPWRRALDIEPSSTAEIGELSSGGGSFSDQVQREGSVQRNSNLRKLPPATAAPIQRHISAYEDHDGNYKGAGRRLMGQDAAPKTADEKMLLEHKIARQRLEAM